MTLHVYEIEDGERNWYVAESPKEALDMHHGIYGEDTEGATVRQLADDEPLKVYQDEPFHDPTPSITKTCGGWATQKGVIATTCY
jgi:hypothetical protein